ncbi:MAG: cell division protein FtsZ [Bacteroidia bacterium]
MPNENYFEDWASQFSNENEPLKNEITTPLNHQTEQEIINTTLPETPINTTHTTNEQITSTPHTNHNIMESTTHTTASIIKVIGVGGGGGNAVNHMYLSGIEGVDFVVCNTDAKDLAKSPIEHKIQIGAQLTEGRGAGAKPEVGKNAAIENIDEIKNVLQNTKMVFITAGMGGGTGTGAAPIIAGVAKEMGILTVGIVTIPFSQEGAVKRRHAEAGVVEMRKNVDTLIVICNDKLREMHGSLPFTQAFAKADDVLATAARSIAEIISTTGIITQDFNDVRTVMENGGTAIMGIAITQGEDRAHRVIESALSSPLLNDNNIKGASQVLLSITCGAEEATMDEIGEIQDYIQNEAGENANIILGLNKQEELGDAMKLILIATGFESSKNLGFEPTVAAEKKINVLTDDSNSKLYKATETPVVASTPIGVSFESTTTVTSKYNVEDENGFMLKKVEPTLDTTNQIQPTFNNSATTSASYEDVVNTQTEEKTEEQTIVKHTLFSTVEEEEEEEINEIEFSTTTTETTTYSSVTSNDDIPFEIVSTTTSHEELNFTTYTKDEETVAQTTTSSTETTERKVYDLQGNSVYQEQPSKMEHIEKNNDDRIKKLKQFNAILKSRSGLADMENEPAYRRKGVQLNDVTPSDQTDVSRFTLSETDNNKTEIRPNNSFLHDNVD